MHSHYSFQTECISLLNYTFVKFKLNLIKHTAIYKNLTCVLPEKKKIMPLTGNSKWERQGVSKAQ